MEVDRTSCSLSFEVGSGVTETEGGHDVMRYQEGMIIRVAFYVRTS